MLAAADAIGFWLTALKSVVVLVVLALFFVQLGHGRTSLKMLREWWWPHWW